MALTYNKDDNDIVLCREFYSDVQAHIAEAALNQEGIMCIIDNELFSRIYPIGFAGVGGLRLMVKKKDLDRASKILDSLDLSGE